MHRPRFVSLERRHPRRQVPEQVTRELGVRLVAVAYVRE